MDITDLIIPGIIVVVAFFIVMWIMSLRRIVPPGVADVVTKQGKVTVYSTDVSVVKNPDGTEVKEPRTVYYEWPGSLPKIGVYVRRMPLTIVEIPVKNYKTFAKGNARFVVDVSVYCRIIDVLIAAQRFPGRTMDDFIVAIREIIVSAIRRTTANFSVEDVIGKRQEIADEIGKDIAADFLKWGVMLTNVAVVDIRDPYKEDSGGNIVKDKTTGEASLETTVIRDISNKKEAEINSLSRREVATQNRQAVVVEAEMRQEAETRKIEAEEAIQRREQEKLQNIAKKQQEAVAESLEVTRRQQVIGAEITANASIKSSEGQRQSAINVADGQRQKLLLEGQGQAEANKAIGLANAEVIKQTKFAEADGLSRYAEAQAKQQEKAKEIRQIEYMQVVGLEVAKALQAAKIEFIGTGTPEKFLDFFTPGGGMNVGGALAAGLRTMKSTDPDSYERLMKLIFDAAGTGSKLVKSVTDTIEPSRSSPSASGMSTDDAIAAVTEAPTVSPDTPAMDETITSTRSRRSRSR